jgi:hypothetical protein
MNSRKVLRGAHLMRHSGNNDTIRRYKRPATQRASSRLNFGDVAMASMRTLAFAGLTVFTFVGAAAAQEAPITANQFYSLYQTPNDFSAVNEFTRYDHSGTRGRLDLGATPLRPEGPGNVSD